MFNTVTSPIKSAGQKSLTFCKGVKLLTYIYLLNTLCARWHIRQTHISLISQFWYFTFLERCIHFCVPNDPLLYWPVFKTKLSLLNVPKTNYVQCLCVFSVWVSNSDCRAPALSIKDEEPANTAPRSEKRSVPFVVKAETNLNCSVTLQNTKRWTVEQVNPDGSQIESVDITGLYSRCLKSFIHLSHSHSLGVLG